MSYIILHGILSRRDKDNVAIDEGFALFKQEMELAKQVNMSFQDIYPYNASSTSKPLPMSKSVMLEAAISERFDIVDYVLSLLTFNDEMKERLLALIKGAISTPPTILACENLIILLNKLRKALNLSQAEMEKICIVEAAQSPQIDLLKKLLASAETIESKSNVIQANHFVNQAYENHNSLLIFAAQAQQFQAITLLLDYQADVNSVNDKLESALSVCAEHKNTDSLSTILNHPNAKPTVRTLRQALAAMMRANNVDAAKLIITKIDIPNYYLSSFMTDQSWNDIFNNGNTDMLSALLLFDTDNESERKIFLDDLAAIRINAKPLINTLDKLFTDDLMKNAKIDAMIDLLLETGMSVSFNDYSVSVRTWKKLNLLENKRKYFIERQNEDNINNAGTSLKEYKLPENPQQALPNTLKQTEDAFLIHLGLCNFPLKKDDIELIRLAFSEDKPSTEIPSNITLKLSDLHGILLLIITFSQNKVDKDSATIATIKFIDILFQMNKHEILLSSNPKVNIPEFRVTPLQFVLSKIQKRETVNRAEPRDSIIDKLLSYLPYEQIRKLDQYQKDSYLKNYLGRGYFEDEDKEADLFDLFFYIYYRDDKTDNVYLARFNTLKHIVFDLEYDRFAEAYKVIKDCSKNLKGMFYPILGIPENVPNILNGIILKFKLGNGVNEAFKNHAAEFIKFLHANEDFNLYAHSNLGIIKNTTPATNNNTKPQPRQ